VTAAERRSQVAELRAALRGLSSEELLDAIVVLTHKIHGASSDEAKDALRGQRTLARAEVIRRLKSKDRRVQREEY